MGRIPVVGLLIVYCDAREPQRQRIYANVCRHSQWAVLSSLSVLTAYTRNPGPDVTS